MEGWIKLHRKFLAWEWYNKSEMVHLFIHLLLSANHISKKWQGIQIERGQFLCSRETLANSIGVSCQVIRSCLTKLISTNEITIKTTNKYSIITICNYDSYQVFENNFNQQDNQLHNQQSTNNQPTINQQLTTTKKDKNVKNVNNENKFIAPNIEDVKTYFTENNYSLDSANKFYNYYNVADWKDSKGTKIRNWKQKAQAVWFVPQNKIAEIPKIANEVKMNPYELLTKPEFR
jgi:hypothetical protein